MSARARSSRSVNKRREESNRPPANEPWTWKTLEMLESHAWQAMTLAARRILDRIEIEHMGHGGTQNGKLIVTYDQFAELGIRRKSIAEAIRTAVALGFLDVTVKGRPSWGGARLPSSYGLTWLPRADLTPASNRWKAIKTKADAEMAARRPGDKPSTAAPRRDAA